jgi:hypothetical protein
MTVRTEDRPPAAGYVKAVEDTTGRIRWCDVDFPVVPGMRLFDVDGDWFTVAPLSVPLRLP